MSVLGLRELPALDPAAQCELCKLTIVFSSVLSKRNISVIDVLLTCFYFLSLNACLCFTILTVCTTPKV
jgi:TRAP-type mannitol/chloroaromatic compound transport system permease small subunit